MTVTHPSTPKLVRGLLFVLVASASYLYPLPQANVVYPMVVAIHVLAGILATIVGAAVLSRLLRHGTIIWKTGWLLLAGGTVLGLLLLSTGTSRSGVKWLY